MTPDLLPILSVSKKHLKPSVRTEYRRVAFQRSDCNAVRVSLDVDLTFSGAVGFADEEFCGRGREGSDETFVGVDGTRVGGGGTDGVFKRTRSVKFPYAILEIKTRDETPPGWVEEVLHEIPVLEVRKFSKFLHATMLTRTRAAAAAADKSETRFKEGALKESDYSAPHWWCFDSATGADARDLVSTRGRDFFVSGAVSDGCARLPAGALSTRDHVAVTVRDDSHPHPRGDASPDANGYDSNSNSSGEITSVDSNTTTGGSSSGISGLTRAEVGVLERFFKSNNAQGQGRASLGQGRANTLGHRGSTDTPLRGKTWCFPSTYSFRDTRGNGGETHGKRHVPVKVEPKTFFANERTLLQWLSMSVLLLFASLVRISHPPHTAFLFAHTRLTLSFLSQGAAEPGRDATRGVRREHGVRTPRVWCAGRRHAGCRRRRGNGNVSNCGATKANARHVCRRRRVGPRLRGVHGVRAVDVFMASPADCATRA